MLQREIDGGARAAAVVEIQRGCIRNQVESMVRSGKSTTLRASHQLADQLEAI